MDLSSRVFDQEGLTFDMLKAYDLVIWDDLGTIVNGVSSNDVAIFQQLYAADIPLYFMGDDLAKATANLPLEQRSVWTRLLHLNPTDADNLANRVTIADT